MDAPIETLRGQIKILEDKIDYWDSIMAAQPKIKKDAERLIGYLKKEVDAHKAAIHRLTDAGC